MKLTLEPTPEVMVIDGTMCRIWSGTDAAGVPVKAAMIYVSPQTHDPETLKRYTAELLEIALQTSETPVIDMRFMS